MLSKIKQKLSLSKIKRSIIKKKLIDKSIKLIKLNNSRFSNESLIKKKRRSNQCEKNNQNDRFLFK